MITSLAEPFLRKRGGKKWTTYPSDVLPLWLADMDFEVAPPVQGAIERAVAVGGYTYPGESTYLAVEEAFLDRMATRFAWSPWEGGVTMLADLVQALTTSVLAFSEPGDGVIVMTPIYPPFLRAASVGGRRMVDVAMVDRPEGFVVDLDRLEDVAQKPDVRMLLLCNPHNPTGRVLTLAELRAVAEVAERHDLVVVSDEVHSDLTMGNSPHVAYAAVAPDQGAGCVTLQSASKSFNLGGLRCAVMHFGSQALRDRFEERFPDRTLGRVTSLSAEATVAAWTHGGVWLEELLGLLRRNHARVQEWVRASEHSIESHPGEGTYFAWLDFGKILPPGVTAHAYLRDAARVALLAGEDFRGPRHWARLNFATSPEILDSALSRLDNAITSHDDASTRGVAS